MRDSGRKPSARQFVAYFEAHAKVKRKNMLPDCEQMDPLEQDESVQVIRTAGVVKDPRRAWKRLQTALPEAVVVPALVDEDGHMLYPTGTIQVRFAEPPSEQALDEFARKHALADVTRNRYQPAQVSCRPADRAGSYLPDLIGSLGESPGVRRAWAETKSRYERL